MAKVPVDALILWTDHELIRDGRAVARAELWRRWYRWLERRARRYSGDTRRARDCFVDDVLSRTWSEFLEAPMVADSVPRCKALLKTMLHYNALDSLRKQRRFIDGPLPERPANARSPFDCAMVSRMRHDVCHALRTLSSQQARVLHLRYWEDMTSAEIAAVEGISIANVDQIACRARRRLGPVLQKWRPAARISVSG